MNRRARIVLVAGVVALIASGCIVNRPPDAVVQSHTSDAEQTMVGSGPLLAATVLASGATHTTARASQNFADPNAAWVTVPSGTLTGVDSVALGATYIPNSNVPVVLTGVKQAGQIAHTFVSALRPDTLAVTQQVELNVAPAGSTFQAQGIDGGGNYLLVYGTGSGTFNGVPTDGRDAVVVTLNRDTLAPIATTVFRSTGDDNLIALGAGNTSSNAAVLWQPTNGAPASVALMGLTGGTVWQKQLPSRDYTGGSIFVDSALGVAVGGLDGVQFLNSSGDLGAFASIAPGVRVNGITLSEAGLVVAGTTSVAINKVPVHGGTDLFVAGFDASNTMGWVDIVGTPADEHFSGIGFFGAVYLSGTTTGAFSGSADAGGDAFVAKYTDPKLSGVVGLAASVSGTTLTASWTKPAVDDGFPVLDYRVTVTPLSGPAKSTTVTATTGTVSVSGMLRPFTVTVQARGRFAYSPVEQVRVS